jgi:hypothetical protein
MEVGVQRGEQPASPRSKSVLRPRHEARLEVEPGGEAGGEAKGAEKSEADQHGDRWVE